MSTLKQRKKQAQLNLNPEYFSSGTSTPRRNGDLKATTAHSPPILSPTRENDPKRARSDKHTTPTDKDAAQIDRGPHRDDPMGPVVSPNEATPNDIEEYNQNPPSPPKRPTFDGGTADAFMNNVDNDLTQMTLQDTETYNEDIPSNTTTQTVATDDPYTTTNNTEVTDDQQDTEIFTTVSRQRHPQIGFGKWQTFTKKGVCANNRTYMAFWNYKIAVDPAKIKNGAVMKWIMNHLKEFFIKAKQLDEKFVLYKYKAQAGEPDAILEVTQLPTSFSDLNGGGKANRYNGCYVHGLRTWDSKGKPMNVHTEIRVGYEQKDLPALLQEYVQTLSPAPYLRPKDLQAPDTVEIGFLFMSNPMMRDRTVFEKLKKITTAMAIQKQEHGVVFAVSNRFLQDGNYEKKKKKSDNFNPLQSPRALHIEGLASDRSRTKGYIKTALKSPLWKNAYNAPVSLLPTVRDAKEPSRAKMSIEQHRNGMANLGWTSTTQLVNPDRTNPIITKDDGKPASLRDIIMDMDMPVEIHEMRDGQRHVKKTKDKMFQSVDERFRKPGEFVFVYPKAYEKMAKNRVNGLYAYVRHLHHNNIGGTLSECDDDIACWFTNEARENAQDQSVEDGTVITNETLEQRQALADLSDTLWITGLHLLDSPGQGTTMVDKTARKFNPDTASIHTQHTTATKIISSALEAAVARANTTSMVDLEDGNSTTQEDSTPSNPMMNIDKGDESD